MREKWMSEERKFTFENSNKMRERFSKDLTGQLPDPYASLSLRLAPETVIIGEAWQEIA